MADDGSPDGTADAVRPLVAEFPGRVGLVEREREGGAGCRGPRQLQAGARWIPRAIRSSSRWTQISPTIPNEIPKFREKLDSTDMVIGSRYIPGGGSSDWGFWRPLLSWVANRYIALVAGVPVRDTTSGYRAYRRQVLVETEFDRIKIRGYVVHGEMAYQAWVHGFRLGEVPIHFKNRAREASKLSGEEIYTALLNFALLRFRYGFRPRRRRREE